MDQAVDDDQDLDSGGANESLVSLQDALREAEVTKLNLGTSTRGLSLTFLDGDLTRSILSASMRVIQHQAAKLEQYEDIMRKFSSHDLAKIQRRMDVSENMIKNLAHNIQGYVDPDEMGSPKRGDSTNAFDDAFAPTSQQRRSTITSLPKKTNEALPSNFLDDSQRKKKSLPLSPKIRSRQRSISGDFKLFDSKEVSNELPVIPQAEETKNDYGADNTTEEESKDTNEEGSLKPTDMSPSPPSTATIRPVSSDGVTSRLSIIEASPTGSETAALSPEGTTTRTAVGTTASKKASSNIARRRFIKASKAITFTNNLKRVSMLKSRAPKEFSVVERVARAEEQMAAMAKNFEALNTWKGSIETKIAEMKESDEKSNVMEMFQAFGRRLQSVEQGSKDGKAIEQSTEQVMAVVNKIQTTVNAKIDNLENIDEEKVMAKILTVQQRIVETTNSYHSLTKEIANAKMPEGNDEMKALKILQYHSRLQGIRHRLTHLDSEFMLETDRFSAMKTEKDIMEKRGSQITTAITEIFANIQEKINLCVKLNKDLWNQLTSIDNAAGNAWGKVARLISGGTMGAVQSAGGSGRLSMVDLSGKNIGGTGKAEAKADASDEKGEEKKIIAPDEFDTRIELMIKSVLDDQLANGNLAAGGGGTENADKINDNALKAVDEKLEATKKMMQELVEENNLLKAQIGDKADAADIQSALRASRMAQSAIEGKADISALESIETFLHKCRKEVVKLRSSQEAGISSTRRILERKLKHIMKETIQIKESGDSNSAFIGTGPVSISPRSGSVEKGVTWKSDKSKFVPSQPAVSKGGGVVVTKGNFLMSMPGGTRGRRAVGEDPPRAGVYAPVSESLGKMFVDTTGKGGVGLVGSEEVKAPLPKAGTKPSRIVKNRQGGEFWGDMDVKIP
ncbi:hypothetical protein TrST_g9700 [Triparma strigata]|uniref:Uncharacterized protein n=1 Tax=Triparma strigata TaxID=1606541 RepID=A0A9W7DVZ8_9STRA|nr:hypothetical protein TrST_g9700 [Triparma strigata]